MSEFSALTVTDCEISDNHMTLCEEQTLQVSVYHPDIAVNNAKLMWHFFWYDRRCRYVGIVHDRDSSILYIYVSMYIITH